MSLPGRDWKPEDIDALSRLWKEGTLIRTITFRLDRTAADVIDKANELGLSPGPSADSTFVGNG